MEKSELKEIQIIDWGRLDYPTALVRQRQMVDQRIRGRSPDRLLLVEHPPVVTIGRSGSLNDLHVSKAALEKRGVGLQQVERGGRATFHGPGQLVAYPIVKVADKDLHAFLKQLIDTAADLLRSYGLDPEFLKAEPGVWVNGAKIASVGLAVRKWVTYHGIALNVSTDPAWFEMIIPCGRPGERITSMENGMGRSVKMSEVKKRFVTQFINRFAYKASEKSKIKAQRDPRWLVAPPTDLKAVGRMAKRLAGLQLATVCQSAHCPNLGECFAKGTATFMIMGTRCTRRCRFCAVGKGSPAPPDADEPRRIAMAIGRMGVKHAVVTSVTRDDLPDGGAGHFVQTIRQIHRQCPGVSVEVLVPDFGGALSAFDAVCGAGPEIFNHNIETVPRLYAKIRPRADYRRSLGIVSYAASRGAITKSGLMLGLGETQDEIKRVIGDLKKAGCMLLTIGQYLAPSINHAPVARHVPPEEFEMWAKTARDMGFTSVASGPLVRSSYGAGEMKDAGQRDFGVDSMREAG
ncbi:MAG: lipoyl synthase [Desulfobacteraceae bacterium]